MNPRLGRRDALKALCALCAAGVPTVSALAAAASAHFTVVTGGSLMKTAYDPGSRFELEVSEVEFRRAVSGRMLMARIEGNPQQILDRREPVTLAPLLIMQGALDDNVLPAV